MRTRWTAVPLALLAACAAMGGELDAAEVDRRLTECERALECGDLTRARAEIDAASGVAFDGAQRGRAQRLQGEVAARELEPFEALFVELGAALAARDTALAQQLLARLEARGPRGAAAQRAQAFRNVVDGRSSAAAVQLELEAEPTEVAGEFRVVLTASQATGERVRVRCPGSALDFAYVGVNAAGIETRTKRRLLVEALADLELDSGVPRRVVLASFALPIGGLLACRGEFALLPAAGAIERGGRELPANELAVRSAFAERRDARLPPDAVEPEAFRDYVERGAPSIAALLERAARIAPERRLPALDLASKRLRAGTDDELERLAPALRWLSGARNPPTGGAGWRAWLERRAAELEKPPRPTLELPVR